MPLPLPLVQFPISVVTSDQGTLSEVKVVMLLSVATGRNAVSAIYGHLTRSLTVAIVYAPILDELRQ